MTTTSSASRRKVLVPLATLLAAGAVAVGSGATFTSTTNHASAVTAGNLKHGNNQNGLKMDVTKIKPGDSITGTVVITNDGDLNSTLTLQETSDATAFTAGDLKLVINKGATELYSGNFGALDNTTKLDLGALPVGVSTTVTFTVSMPSTAGNENQGKTASAAYQWVSTQTSPSQVGLDWK